MLLAACSGIGDAGYPRATGPDDLKGYNVGCIGGGVVDLNFEKCAPGAIKQIYNNPPDLLSALDNGKAQFIIVDSALIVGIDTEIHPIEAAYHEPVASVTSVPHSARPILSFAVISTIS